MSDYITQLKTWGATGAEFPGGYSYIEGEQPVDAWDNFLQYHTINDIQHLISLTNDRIESDSGTSFPSSPESEHVFYRSDNERLTAWDSTSGEWHGLMRIDGDTLQGGLDVNSNSISNVGSLTMSGTADVSGNDLKDSSSGSLLYDSSAGEVPLDVLEQSKVTVGTGDHVSGGGTISLGGSLTIDVDDDFLLNTGDRLTGELTATVDGGTRAFTAKDSGSGDKLSMRVGGSNTFQLVGYDSSDGAWDYNSALTYDPNNAKWSFGSLPSVNGNSIATQSWVDNNASVTNAEWADNAGQLDGHDSSHFTTLSEVNSNADVPNADYADSAGDATTLDGHDSTYFTTMSEVNGNADVPNADYADSAGDAGSVDGHSSEELEKNLGTYHNEWSIQVDGVDDGVNYKENTRTVYLTGEERVMPWEYYVNNPGNYRNGKATVHFDDGSTKTIDGGDGWSHFHKHGSEDKTVDKVDMLVWTTDNAGGGANFQFGIRGFSSEI